MSIHCSHEVSVPTYVKANLDADYGTLGTQSSHSNIAVGNVDDANRFNESRALSLGEEPKAMDADD